MSEFTDLIKEAFVGEEPYDPKPGREDLEAAIRKFENRDRTMRFLTWFAVTFQSAVLVFSIWKFWTADEATTSPKTLIIYATLSVWAMIAIGFMKTSLFTTQLGLGLRKDLKRLQLQLTERD